MKTRCRKRAFAYKFFRTKMEIRQKRKIMKAFLTPNQCLASALHANLHEKFTFFFNLSLSRARETFKDI